MNMPYQQPMMNYTPNYGAYQYNPRDYKGLDNYGSNGVIEWKN